MLTSRRKRPLNRSIPHLRDTRLIVIATEGALTEKQYFESSMFHHRRVQVKVIPTTEGQSAPNHVYNRLKQFAAETDLQPDDQLWLVIDKDRWTDRMLSEICSKSLRRKHRIHPAVSNPSFEMWLYLHIDEWNEGNVPSQNVESALRTRLGSYNKSNLDIDMFKNGVSDAISRAQQMDPYPSNWWPSNPGTHVFRVVEVIRLLAN